MRISLIFLLLLLAFPLQAEDGYRLWLRYDRLSNPTAVRQYRAQLGRIYVEGNSPVIQVLKEELNLALAGLLNLQPQVAAARPESATLIVAAWGSRVLQDVASGPEPPPVGDAFLIRSVTTGGRRQLVIAAATDTGLLYGAFHLIRLIQTGQPIHNLNIRQTPKTRWRVLNHWDNLDGTVERGYAGFSIWNWHTLPGYIDQRYRDYARANASIGINGAVLTNVNANAWALTTPYLQKAAALADVFRPYGIRVFLTARFSAPMELGGLPTADPANPEVQQWWLHKVNEIYSLIPDFGGFLVKANSEGQPGPQNYGRTHADGANMLADALAPHGGVVMWRAFVYDDKEPDDRARQAFSEFKPLDGLFKPNVVVQVKNGAIDFQPREPFHPLFGAMKKTPVMMEFQITQEYLGQGTHLVYLANLYKECLDADTFQYGPGTSVAKIIDGSVQNLPITGMAGVANIGSDRNWCGHPFAQANWYAFGRLAWDHELTAGQIAYEWINMTFTANPGAVSVISSIMEQSWETTVDYMTPLGLHHIMGWNHHYGPAPWIQNKHRADWTSVYYHRADTAGLGFNRTETGANAVGQYAPPVNRLFSSREECPEKFLLWFHHVGWDEKLKSGRTLWNELCFRYYTATERVAQMQNDWNAVAGYIDAERFNHVRQLLQIQYQEAVWWRNACVLYFQTFSKRPIPKELPAPDKSLDYYMKLEFPYAPGIKPQW
jgi:alpha-glucuronidase